MNPAPVLYHRDYLINLPDQSRGEIEAEFQKMLGPQTTICSAGALDPDGVLLWHLRSLVSALNNRSARRAKEYPRRIWRKLKLVLWRGCWCVTVREVRL